MAKRSLLFGFLLTVLLCFSTEGKRTSRAHKLEGMLSRNIMMADDPLFRVEEVPPKSWGSKKGICSCECCEEPPAPLIEPPCLNDIIVAVDSSACFRDHHRRMVQFLQRLVMEIHKRGGDAQFGDDKTRLGILQFSSEIETPILLDDFENYRNPSQSKRLRNEIVDHLGKLGFLGEGAFLNRALNASALEFVARPRVEGNLPGRKVVVMLTNGKSHPDVTSEDIENSVAFLRDEGVVVLPVSVTKRCYGVSSSDWDEGLCPDVETLNKLSQLSTYDDESFLAMRAAGTVQTIAQEATDCHFDPPPQELNDFCNNCTCECDLPIGPRGGKGDRGEKGDSIQGEQGIVGPKGQKGNPGVIGNTGREGPKGTKGDVGPRGPQGEVGYDGAQGPEGFKGEIGSKGATGEIGPRGPRGEVGRKGDTGEKGNTGRKGDTGNPGVDGPQGVFGQKGGKGDFGAPGVNGIGIKGNEGDRGPKGSKGDEGRYGDDGPTGPKGMQGLCGKPGPAGIEGLAGLPGVDGRDGETGPPGIQGPRGPEGFQGDKGERGSSGADGQPGPMGPEGPTGPEGSRGARGFAGEKGRDSIVPGPRGPEGSRGLKGERGDVGLNGLAGLQGEQGVQGPRGEPGLKGMPGTVDLNELKPLLVDIIRDLLPGECVTPPEVTTDDCREFPIDLVFLVDGSDSIDREDFKDVQKWILRTVDRFHPMERDEKLKLFVVQFSHEVAIEVQATIQNSSEEVRADLESIKQLRAGTKTYTGLRYINTDVSPITRRGAYKILITMTDGDASEDRDQMAIDTARDFYNIMLGVGIGDKIDREELQDFAHINRVITVDEFGALGGIIEQIVEKSCASIREEPQTTESGNAGEPTPPPEAGYSSCADGRADVAFLIDGSSLVGEENFSLLQEFLYDVISSFDVISPYAFRVAIIQYNDNPRVELEFESSVDHATVLNTVNSLSYMRGSTKTGKALDSAAGLFAAVRESGDRIGSQQVAVVITGGRSQDDVVEPALALKEDGAIVFAVGVTESSIYEELESMASSPESDHIYSVLTYAEIDTIRESILKKICDAVDGTYVAPEDDLFYNLDGSGLEEEMVEEFS